MSSFKCLHLQALSYPPQLCYFNTQFIIEGHAELVREAYEEWHAKDSVVDWIISDNRNLTRKLRNFLSKHALFMEPDALDVKSTVKQELQINNDKKQLPGPYATKKILLGPKLAD